ncbi:hypothetical protein ACFWH1_18620 [Streptomyces sp. NPDC127037]|uniref:hypothetical protein n=1 Tax=Streptomyces sp. NPDC127037 TaxID=3347113 RepID=UPI003649CD07
MGPVEETTQPESESPAPFRVRDVFSFRRAAKPEAAGDAKPEIPPMPTEPPAIPAAPISGGGRLPAWWEPKRDIIANTEFGKWLNGDLEKESPAEECEHPNPHAVHARPTGQLVAYWCEECGTQLDVPADYDELDALDEEEDEVPTSIRHRWTMRGNGKKTYSRPTYGKSSDDAKKSGIEAWTALPRKTRHLLYNGTALGAGFYLGVPQYFRDEVAYLVANHGSWTNFSVCVWYGIAIGIWVLDHRTRNWFPPFALVARIPLVSMVVGVLLYGNPAA